MKIKLDLDIRQLSIVVDSSKFSGTQGFGFLTKAIVEKYEPFFNHLDDYLDNAIQVVPQNEIPNKDILSQDNFTDLTVYKRISVFDLWDEMLGWEQPHEWNFYRYLIESCRFSKDLVPYITNRFPNVYVFNYEVIDPDLSDVDFYVGIVGKRDPTTIVRQTEYHKLQGVT